VFKKAVYPFHCYDEETFLEEKAVVAISVQKLEPVTLLIAMTTVSELIQSLTDTLSISPSARYEKYYRRRYILQSSTHPTLLASLFLCPQK